MDRYLFVVQNDAGGYGYAIIQNNSTNVSASNCTIVINK